MRNPGENGKDQDAGQRQEQQRSEEPRDLEPVARLEDARRKSRFGAARAGDALALIDLVRRA